MIVFWDAVRLWLLLSLATLFAALLLRPAPTQADDALHHAGLIVRDADGRLTYAWVPFTEDEIDGITFLKRSGIPTVTVGFGALGEGVCSIGSQGCDVAECRRNVCQASAIDAPYWQFFQQDTDDPSHWQWQMLGASSTRVRDGDVFGWSWTGREPALPALTAPEIAALAGAHDPNSEVAHVATYLPDGVAAILTPPPPDLQTTLAAVGILVLIAGTGAALNVARRRAIAA
jgi:hypothetical protein